MLPFPKGKASPAILVIISAVLLSSCATIVAQSHQTIGIKSNPDGATAKVYDIYGNLIQNGTTPFMVTLKKGRGYFQSAEYKVVIEKSGYRTSEIQISGRVGGWYAFGNLLFGGFIGYLIVDPISGAMWVLTPEEINTSLGGQTALLKNEEGLMIVLKENVPPDLQKVMKLIKD